MGSMDVKPLVVVSSDCHVGPRLVEDLRPYCPPEWRGAFDAYVDDSGRSSGRYIEQSGADVGDDAPWRNRHVAGHHDPAARRADLDAEGVAAEVMFHGSQNDQPIPFQTSMLGPPSDPDLAALGMHLYNQWLVDVCAQAPDRHVGLAHLPLWDIEASIAELRWAREVGLRGINFPAPRPWLRPYNDPEWEPFWAAAEEMAFPLTTHSGAGDAHFFNGPEYTALMTIESGGWFSRRAAHQLIFSGVFERHPELTLVLTEQPGQWWSYMELELDSVYVANAKSSALLRRQVPKAPSVYLHQNVFVGASFLSRDEARAAVAGGYGDRLMWGSDYPHMEGTFQAGPVSYGRLALRFTFAGLAEADVERMVGGTAITVYGLHRERLAAEAARIGAPRFADISVPVDAVPPGASPFAFRTMGPWA